ncbi:DegV family protein [Chloroflexota bacterium]
MTIKIVTDSTADLPPELIKELGITVVPLYVCFGKDVYRDREDITEDDFYTRLLYGDTHPTTTQPTPQDFAEVYRRLASEADGIVSIHISGKLSGTLNSALQGKKMAEDRCPIEVIDSKTTSMALGLIVMAAANMVKTGTSLPQMTSELEQVIPSVQLLVLFDTLKYLAKGGRIGKAKSLLGSVLSVKPILTIKDGEFVPVSQVRSRAKGIEKLFDFAQGADKIEDLAIIYSTTPDEARSLGERVSSIIPQKQIRTARLGPVLGTHGGPGVLAVAFRRGER